MISPEKAAEETGMAENSTDASSELDVEAESAQENDHGFRMFANKYLRLILESALVLTVVILAVTVYQRNRSISNLYVQLTGIRNLYNDETARADKLAEEKKNLSARNAALASEISELKTKLADAQASDAKPGSEGTGAEAAVQNGISAGRSEADFKGTDYRNAVRLLKEAGFTNITAAPVYDIVFGVLVKEGEVSKVTIDGQDDYTAGDLFDPGAPVIVSYHSNIRNNPALNRIRSAVGRS